MNIGANPWLSFWRLPGRHVCLRARPWPPTHPATAPIAGSTCWPRFWSCGARGICLRLVYLQIFRYGSFEKRAIHERERTEEVSAKRGIIYDRTGRELAMSIAVDSAFAVPTEIPDLAGTVSLISKITKTDPREILAKCKAARTFAGWRAKPMRRPPTHSRAESPRNLFSERIQAFLSQARTRGPGARLCRHG